MNTAELLESLLSTGDVEEQRVLLRTHGDLVNQETLEEWKERAQTYARNGDEQRALSVAGVIQAIGEWQNEASVLALADWTRGNIYTIVGRGSDAWTRYQAAGHLYRTTGDWLNLARMSVGAVGALYHTGAYGQACQLAEEIIPILAASREPEDRRRLASVANNLANVYDHLGRWEEALEQYGQKIKLWQSWPDDPRSPAEIARACINIGVIKKQLNLWAEAEISLKAGRQTLADPAWIDIYRLDLIRAEMHLVDLLARQGAASEIVMEAFERARQARAAISAGQDIPDLLQLDLYEAEWRLRTGYTPDDFADRLRALRERAMTAAQAYEMMWADLLLAGYYTRQGDTSAAIAGYTTTLATAREHDDWEMLYRAWFGLGRAYAVAEDVGSVTRSLRSAVAVIESVGRDVTSGDLRSGFLDDKLAVYQELAALHLGGRNSEKALHWVERARSRELAEMLSEGRAPPSVELDTAPLLEQLTQVRRNLATSLSPQDRLDLEERITDLSRRIASLGPRNGRWLTGETATSADLCAAIPAETILLIYAVVRGTLWVFPLTRSGMHTPRLLGSAPTAEEVERDIIWLRNLSRYPLPLIERRVEALVASAQRPLTEWFNRFLAPLSDLLSQYQKIVVAPDGPLFRLPFHAFYDLVSGCYTIETHQVVYAPGATAWLWGSQRARSNRGGVVLGCSGDRLHHVAAEINAILEPRPDFVAYTGQEATPERLWEDVTTQAAFIHLAAHAVFRGDNPLFSYVELTDRKVETLDVLQLRLSARLVALSACETGLGLLRGGEYMGLARAFLLAGVQSVLATHWAVDDLTTAEFMGDFYRHIEEEKPLGEALRVAQLAMLSSDVPRHRHPYYWAPFFILGSDGADETVTMRKIRHH